MKYLPFAFMALAGIYTVLAYLFRATEYALIMKACGLASLVFIPIAFYLVSIETPTSKPKGAEWHKFDDVQPNDGQLIAVYNTQGLEDVFYGHWRASKNGYENAEGEIWAGVWWTPLPALPHDGGL